MPPPNNRFNALAYVRQIAYAIGARQYALSATAAQFTPPAVGDRADRLVAAFQTALTFGWGSTPGTLGTFIRPDWSMDGLNAADALGTSGNFDLSRRAYCNLPAPAAAWMAANQGGVPTTGSLYGKLQSDAWWRRRKPRTVTDLTATTDTDGNAAAAGQVAFYNPGWNPSASAYGTDLYAAVYSAPNQPAKVWSRDDSQQPDVLDSTRDAPTFTPPGVAQVGDYIGGYKGEHVWTEIEAIANASTTAFGVTINTAMTTRGAGDALGADGWTTLQQAEQGTATEWGNGSPSAYPGSGPFRAATHWQTDNRYYTASIQSLSGTVTDASYNTAQSRTTKAFSLGGPPAGSGYVFNALGAPVANGLYKLVGSAASITFATDQPPTAYPTDPGAPPLSRSAGWGFQVSFATLLTFTGMSTVGS